MLSWKGSCAKVPSHEGKLDGWELEGRLVNVRCWYTSYEQKKKQEAMSEDKSLLASDPFPRAPYVRKEKESPNKTNGKMSHANFNTCFCWSGT